MTVASGDVNGATAEETVAGSAPIIADEPVETYGQIRPLDEANRRLLDNVHPDRWQNPTPESRYNLVVIGGGSAGLVAAVGAAGLGAKVALVERHLLGGDCLNAGCVPSKSLIRAGKVLGEIARAGDFGVQVAGEPVVDFGRVMARMRRVRADISEHDSARRFADLGIDVFLGEARFGGPDTVEVGGQTLQFAKALIATGSRPAAPPIPGLAEAGYLTNETIFQLTERPQRLAVIGAGPIGAELSQAFQRFGSEVTVLEMGERLMIRDDEEAAELLADIFRREGMNLALGIQVERVETSNATSNNTSHNSANNSADNSKVVHYRDAAGAAQSLEVDAILVAAGRVPNIETLDLESAGVTHHPRGVEVDDTMRTTNPNIYAAGDVGFKYQFTHTADATARLVLQNAFFPLPKKKASDLIVPWCTYTDPEVAHVGMYPADAAAQGMDIETFAQPIADTDRGRTDGEQEGFVKVYVKKGSDKILGATIVARHAGEMINEITLAMSQGAGLKALANVIHPYPTQAEAIRKTADAYNRTRLTPLVKRLFGWWLARQR